MEQELFCICQKPNDNGDYIGCACGCEYRCLCVAHYEGACAQPLWIERPYTFCVPHYASMHLYVFVTIVQHSCSLSRTLLTPCVHAQVTGAVDGFTTIASRSSQRTLSTIPTSAPHACLQDTLRRKTRRHERLWAIWEYKKKNL